MNFGDRMRRKRRATTSAWWTFALAATLAFGATLHGSRVQAQDPQAPPSVPAVPPSALPPGVPSLPPGVSSVLPPGVPSAPPASPPGEAPADGGGEPTGDGAGPPPSTPEAPPPAAPAPPVPPQSTAAPPASPAPTAPSTSPGSPVAPPGPAGAGVPADGAGYSVRLRDLQQKIDTLKEQIRRSHTRLSLLSDTILSSGAAGSRASIQFENKLSNLFQVTKALVVLDGAVQYNKSDLSGGLGDQKTIPIFSGSIPPGDHLVQVLVNLRGNGYGVFSYLRGYKFEVRSSHSFTAVEGKATRLRVIAYEKGGATTPLEERPAVRYLEKVGSEEPESANDGN